MVIFTSLSGPSDVPRPPLWFLVSSLITISLSLGGSLPAPYLPCVWVQKWRRFGAMLYGESGCALARLELLEGPEKPRRGEPARRVIRLSDCLRLAEAGGEASSPRDTSAFLLETKERLYLLAAPAAERSDWMQAICLLAFPVSHPVVQKREGACTWEWVICYICVIWGTWYLLWAGVIRAKVRMLGAVPCWGAGGGP